MTPERLQALLLAVQHRTTSVDDALAELRELPFRSLGFANADTHRHLRTGFPEAVLGQGKTPDQIAAILIELARGGSTVLATRVASDVADTVTPVVRGAGFETRYLPVPRAIVVGETPVATAGRGTIAVVTAGTGDIPVAEEAALTVELAGQKVERVFDVGVAGIHRLLARRELLTQCEILVVVAGMEGALPSVVAGLCARPVIAVPTSIGYGANLGGVAALLSMLNSCAGGIAVVNIDNGFGAGQLAAMLNRKVSG